MSDQYGGQQPVYDPSGYGQQSGHGAGSHAYGQEGHGAQGQQRVWGGAPGGQQQVPGTNDAGALAPFLQRFPADPDVVRPGQDFLDHAQGRVPDVLLELWRDHGLGFYGEQRLAIIDPGEWADVLTTWLGSQCRSIPFAVTSFGHLYHYDQVGGRDRIQCLDPHFVSNTVVSDDLVEFFTSHLIGPQSHVADLEGPRGGGREKLGPLEQDEIYMFVPALAIGGSVSPDSLDKGSGPVHLQVIHELVRSHRG